MDRIEDIRATPLAVDLGAVRAYGSSRGRVSQRTTTLIEVVTRNGVVGIGEAWGPPSVSLAYLGLIKAYYVGRDVFDHEQVWPEIQGRHYHNGLQNQLVACVSGIDIAAKDAIGKIVGVPLCKLIGGAARTRVPVYASGGYFTDDPANGFDRQMERLAASTHTAVKIKIGSGIAGDIERVSLARTILGASRSLMVDGNGNYTLDLAAASMRAIELYRIAFYEEPLPPHDFEGYARLCARAPMPIATGEALYTAHDFLRLAQPRCCDILQPDLALCGGFREARAIATLAQLHNLRVSPHVWTSAIGLAAAIHYVASIPAFPHTDHDPSPTLVEFDVGENALRDHLLVDPFTPLDGVLEVPTGPGLGIELDRSAVERFRIR